MACLAKALIEFLKTLDEGARVAVDDGGLIIVEIDDTNDETGNYYEVGGIPLDDDEDA